MGIEQASILNILQCVLVAKMPFTLLDHIKDKYCLLYIHLLWKNISPYQCTNILQVLFWNFSEQFWRPCYFYSYLFSLLHDDFNKTEGIIGYWICLSVVFLTNRWCFYWRLFVSNSFTTQALMLYLWIIGFVK